jgi:ribosomal protein L20
MATFRATYNTSINICYIDLYNKIPQDKRENKKDEVKKIFENRIRQHAGCHCAIVEFMSFGKFRVENVSVDRVTLADIAEEEMWYMYAQLLKNKLFKS